MSVLPPLQNPKVVYRDLKAFLSRRSRENMIALGLALLFTVVIIFIFFIDAKVNTAPPPTITYVESYSANRTDADIKADQVKDQKKAEARAKERQAQFQEIANTFGIK
ncbi:hypothetical protein GCM10022281_08900 [Sphingomonas rosea]|uniref:Energy transducer TonB n=1 Tax=Sphingomonas rosea TaxID=335605 RepID=A0ABP7TUQ7_9SPHN